METASIAADAGGVAGDADAVEVAPRCPIAISSKFRPTARLMRPGLPRRPNRRERSRGFPSHRRLRSKRRLRVCQSRPKNRRALSPRDAAVLAPRPRSPLRSKERRARWPFPFRRKRRALGRARPERNRPARRKRRPRRARKAKKLSLSESFLLQFKRERYVPFSWLSWASFSARY